MVARGIAHIPNGPSRTLCGMHHWPNPPVYNGKVDITNCCECALKQKKIELGLFGKSRSMV